MSTRPDNAGQPPIVTHIRPPRGWLVLDFREFWAYRDLVYFFLLRELKVRYKQTIIGAGWAIIQPLFTMIVFSLFFGRLAEVPSDDLPYPIFSFAALVPWSFFANAVTQASNVLVSNNNMIKKTYFPRVTMPLGTVLAGFVDFLLAFVVLLGMMLFYGIAPTGNIVWLPLLVLLAFVTALGLSLWLSALNVLFRDIRYTIPFLIQLLLFLTPIAYSSTLLSEPWRTLYGINPMAGVVDGFRWALLGTDTAPGGIIAVSSLVAVLILASGLLFFWRMELTFADVA